MQDEINEKVVALSVKGASMKKKLSSSLMRARTQPVSTPTMPACESDWHCSVKSTPISADWKNPMSKAV